MSPSATNGDGPASAAVRFVGSRLEAGLLALAAAAAAVALFLFDPANATFFPPCVFHSLTGFHCPGCGTLRAFHALAHGNVGTAFRFNPLAMLVLPFAAIDYHWARKPTGTP